jgi:hypothetical protein
MHRRQRRRPRATIHGRMNARNGNFVTLRHSRRRPRVDLTTPCRPSNAVFYERHLNTFDEERALESSTSTGGCLRYLMAVTRATRTGRQTQVAPLSPIGITGPHREVLLLSGSSRALAYHWSIDRHDVWAFGYEGNVRVLVPSYAGANGSLYVRRDRHAGDAPLRDR